MKIHQGHPAHLLPISVPQGERKLRWLDRRRRICTTSTGRRAFSLIEIMVATTIFFMAMFSILGVLCAGIHAASILRSSGPTAGMAAGYYYVTNKIVEGNDSGDFGDIASYQGYQWRSSAVEVATNGLFKMEFVVIDPQGNQSSTLDVLIYNPNSGSGQRMGLQPTPR